MTPSLFGRWSTRLWLIVVLGVPITLFFAWLFRGNYPYLSPVPFYILGYVLLVGLILDVLYQYIVTRRLWDYDWPAAYVFIGNFFEGLIVFLLIALVGLPGVPKADFQGWNGVWHFWLHYGSVWFVTFWWVFYMMRAFFIRWRFNAGQFGKFDLPTS